MIKDVVICLNDYVHGQEQGDPTAKYAECPTCGKWVKLTIYGTLYPHGVTRKKTEEEEEDHGLD